MCLYIKHHLGRIRKRAPDQETSLSRGWAGKTSSDLQDYQEREGEGEFDKGLRWLCSARRAEFLWTSRCVILLLP